MNAEHLILHLADEHRTSKGEIAAITSQESPVTELRDLHDRKHGHENADELEFPGHKGHP